MCRHCDAGSEDGRQLGQIIAAAGRARLSRRRVLRALGGLLALPAGQMLQACATVPVTGRSQLRLISPEEEAQLGVAAFQQLRQSEAQQGRLLTEREAPAEHAVVRRVTDKVIGASGLVSTYRWEYMLINAPETVNAAAIAGGRIIIYTGILPVAQTDGGLAAIIGHEVGHVMAHHTAERISQDQVVQVAGAAAGAAGVSELTMAVLGLGAQFGVLLPYGRAQESEADQIGLLLMAKASYDPREAVALWQRMSQAGGGRSPEFLSTHPNPENRIANLQRLMPKALQYYQNPALPLPNRT
jgi:predicted Zn-dependent protease